ncbi:uncharacterized protein LOC132722613 [Ruditapes philippinarum]|uniref:uncharacterized protein LOC132722613 n=1 Tax=Ruditapes philippinarum TaxID=129788 RepID=UPI00295AAAF1|nr:uncharacterized protein LOC132722613 [Ruditapes philippinarum]
MTKLNVQVIICVLTGAFISQVTCQPSDLQIIQSPSACPGVSSDPDKNFVNASCSNGHVVAIKHVTVGSKLQSTGCPDYYEDTHNFSVCCTYDQANDCLFPFYFETLTYHEGCNGRQNCYLGVQNQITDASCTGNLTTLSRYMFIDYYCIEGKII